MPGKDTAPAALAPRLELLALLKQSLPHFALGPEEPNMALGLAARILAARHAPEPLAATARQLAWWTWQKAPLAPGPIRLMASLDSGPGGPDPETRRLIASLDALPEVPDETADPVREAIQAGEHAAVAEQVFPFLAQPGLGPALLGRILAPLSVAGGPEMHRSAIQACAWDAPLIPVKHALMAEWAFLHLPPHEAAPRVLAMDTARFPWWRTYLLAELALRQGERGQGTALLADLWRTLPWQVNAALKLHDAVFPVPVPRTGPEETDAAVLLYSYNKAGLLADTLENLLSTRLGRAKVFVLDNASTDGAGDMLAAMDAKHPGRLNIVTLPVNAGAPAARNWLLSLPEVRARDWAAFVDDDVILPEDWLAHLLAHARAGRATGTVGLRIAGAGRPAVLQSADYNLMRLGKEPPDGDDPLRALPVFDNCSGSPDFGLFSYTRPCASVSGCCHLVNMDSVRDIGGFDIRYTPTQFDDLDRDLSSLLAGRPALYAGGLAIRHVQFSSLAKASTPVQAANVMGNRIKLNAKFDPAAMDKATAMNTDMLWKDLKTKIKALSRQTRRP